MHFYTRVYRFLAIPQGLSLLPVIRSCLYFGFRALDLHRAFGFHGLYKLMTKGIYFVRPLPVRLQIRKADRVRRRFFR